jgi:hypothetical protein
MTKFLWIALSMLGLCLGVTLAFQIYLEIEGVFAPAKYAGGILGPPVRSRKSWIY